jgi:hypothetical protein
MYHFPINCLTPSPFLHLLLDSPRRCSLWTSSSTRGAVHRTAAARARTRTTSRRRRHTPPAELAASVGVAPPTRPPVSSSSDVEGIPPAAGEAGVSYWAKRRTGCWGLVVVCWVSAASEAAEMTAAAPARREVGDCTDKRSWRTIVRVMKRSNSLTG